MNDRRIEINISIDGFFTGVLLGLNFILKRIAHILYAREGA